MGKFTLTKPVYDLIVIYAASVFVIAVKIASPIMVSFFLVHIAEGIVATNHSANAGVLCYTAVKNWYWHYTAGIY